MSCNFAKADWFEPKLVVTVNVLKFCTLISFCSKKIMVIRAGIHKLLVRIANREDPDQTVSSVQTQIRMLQKQSDLGLRSLSRPFLVGS